MSIPVAPNNEQAEYGAEQGGQRWVEYSDRLENMLAGFSTYLLTASDEQSGESVLDIGCGGGRTRAAFADDVGVQGRVLGVDISTVILNVARVRFATRANLTFESSDAGTYSFTPASFDVITSRFGIMFFPGFNIPGLALYLILRPRDTLEEAYARSLEEEALLRELGDEGACPSCRRLTDKEFHFCPSCQTQLKDQCAKCERLLSFSRVARPYCNTTRPGAAPSVKPSGAEASHAEEALSSIGEEGQAQTPPAAGEPETARFQH